jgi:hypothetical protein
VAKKIKLENEEWEIARKAIEDNLINFRDCRISMINQANGLVCREKNGQESSLIRLSIEDALRIGIGAINRNRQK